MPSIYEYGLVPTAPRLLVNRASFVTLAMVFDSFTQVLIPRTQVFMALHTWAFSSYSLVPNHKIFIFNESEISYTVSFNNKSLSQYQQKASLIWPFPVLPVFSFYRQANESLGPNCSLVQRSHMIYCILRQSTLFQCSCSDAQETVTSLLGLIEGFCALKLFSKKKGHFL